MGKEFIHENNAVATFRHPIKMMKICLVLLFSCAQFLQASTVLPREVKETSFAVTVEQQKKKIAGTVVDETGIPIIGANIIESGTTHGTVTDIDGNFVLDVGDNAILQITYIGYHPVEIDTKGQVSLSVVLQEDNQTLDELVVIGYGVQQKRDLTGAISSISEKQFKDHPVKRAAELIQGRIPGVQVTNMSGLPGGGIKMRIRGATSINKSNEPLYIVDGIVSPGAAIHPEDIESIEVLKDASATAVYGSRGANGVVLITTRKGTADTPSISLETSIGFANMMKERQYELMSPYEYATALNQYMGSNTISDGDLEAYRNGSKGVDWMDLMTRTGINQDYRLSLSGGNSQTRFLVSGNMLNSEAITIKSNYRKYSLRANIESELKPWARLSFNINGSKTQTNNRNIDLMGVLNYSPTMEMRNEETGVYEIDPYNSLGYNPYGLLMMNDNDADHYFITTNATLLFQLMDGLTLSVQGAYNYAHDPSYTFESSLVGPGVRNKMTNSHVNGQYWQNTNNLTYQNSFNDHNLTATAVWEISQNKSSSLWAEGRNLSNEIVGYWNIGNADTRTVTNNYSESSIASAFGRIMYNYKRKYFLTGTLRADGSSKFSRKNKWGIFPSVATAWDIAQENFMETNNFFDQLKLRASYGVTGNQDIAPFSTLGMLTSTSYGYGTPNDYTGYWGHTFATPDVEWEKTYQYDLGLDISVLRNKVNLTFDWFLKDSKDLLFLKEVPLYNGGGSFWVNEGSVRNLGFEFGLTTYPVSNSEFVWETNLNGTYIKNEVMDLAGRDFIIEDRGDTTWGESIIMKRGYPRGSFYLYKWKGFDEEGANLYETADGGLTTNPTSADQQIMGQSDPKFTVGWNNMFSWKNWTANIFLYGAFGFDRLNMTHFTTSNMMGFYRFITLRDAYVKGWDNVENKADAKYHSLSNGNSKTFYNSDFWLENASFVKLKNISIAYNIPEKVIDFADIQLSLNAENLFILTKYSGQDPEVTSLEHSGRDAGAYPIPRTFTFGAKITF